VHVGDDKVDFFLKHVTGAQATAGDTEPEAEWAVDHGGQVPGRAKIEVGATRVRSRVRDPHSLAQPAPHPHYAPAAESISRTPCATAS
jgi:hypothetical protein